VLCGNKSDGQRASIQHPKRQKIAYFEMTLRTNLPNDGAAAKENAGLTAGKVKNLPA
jgi:hypothetical protein